MQNIHIPDIGDVEAVEVIELCVAVGDVVGADDPLIVIESDKASMEVPAGTSGTVVELTVNIGDSVSEGDLIAKLQGSTAISPETESASPTVEAKPAVASDQVTSAESNVAEPSVSQSPAADSSAVASTQGASLDISVPDIGDVEEVVVIEVLVQVGEQIAVGDLLVVLESDKASMEVPSEQAGTVTTVHVRENDAVTQGSKLVTLQAVAVASAVPAAEPPGAKTEVAPPAEPAQPQPATPAEVPEVQTASAGAEVYAGPAARRLARELGVDLAAVQGSGDKGRILKEDLKAHVKSRMGKGNASTSGAGIPPIPSVDFAKFGGTETQPLGRTRAVGAQNLHRSWLNIPHVTNHDEADITELEDFRKSLKAESEQRGIKLTPLAFIIKACTKVLAEYPTVNASLDASAENYIIKHYCNVGMAVDTEHGLVVPVIRDADQLGIWALSEAIIELADRARQRKLSPAQMQGGSFSVSSLGNIGGTGFTPIINPPEVAILGVGRMAMSPVWQGESFQPRKMLPLSLSYDHRAINGAEAGRFMARLRSVLGDIRQLVM
ncbi:MAG: dihydrolipoyllysine-residue acetyltransferase [Pseudomonadales bacterium]